MHVRDGTKCPGHGQDQLRAGVRYTLRMSETERLKQLITLSGEESLAAFARKAGIPEGTAQKQFSRGSVPKKSAVKYVEAARNAGVSDATEDWLLFGKGPAPRLNRQPESRVHKNVIPTNIEVRQFDMGPTALIPLWRAVGLDGMAAGATMHIARTMDDSVAGPDQLRHIKSAFAVKAWDDRNAPWLNSGALLFTDRSPPRINDWAIFGGHETESGLSDATVGVFLRRTEAGWHVQIGANRVTLRFDTHRVAWKVVHITP